MMDEMLHLVIAEAAAEAETFAKSSKKVAARVADLILTDRDLLLQSRKVLAQSRSHLKTTNGPRPTINWEQELAHLKTADAHIVGARKRIQRQRQLIRQSGKLHSLTDTAEVILRTMLAALRAMEGHRSVILDRLAREGSTWTQ